MTGRAQALEALVEYVAWHGPLHEDDCPCDDTCDCQFKRINAGVNLACRLLLDVEAPAEGPTLAPTHREALNVWVELTPKASPDTIAAVRDIYRDDRDAMAQAILSLRADLAEARKA